MFTRRTFMTRAPLLFLGGVVCLTGLSSIYPQNRKVAELSKLVNLLSEESIGYVFDSKIRDKLSMYDDYSVSELIGMIFPDKIPESVGEAIQQLRISTRKDFVEGKTIIIEGWMFTKTSLHLSLLQQLL